MKRILRRLLRNEEGVALLEFYITLPFMLILLFGALEITRYIIILQKLEEASYVLTDSVGQLYPADVTAAASQADVGAITYVMNQMPTMMAPFAGASNPTAIIITSLKFQKVDPTTSPPTLTNGNFVRWQRYTNAGVGGVSSSVTGGLSNTTFTGAPGSTSCSGAVFDANTTAALSANTPTSNENMIVGEVFFHYTPFLDAIMSGVGGATTLTGNWAMSAQDLHRRTFLHPRNGDLVDLPDTGSPVVVKNAPCD